MGGARAYVVCWLDQYLLVHPGPRYDASDGTTLLQYYSHTAERTSANFSIQRGVTDADDMGFL